MKALFSLLNSTPSVGCFRARLTVAKSLFRTRVSSIVNMPARAEIVFELLFRGSQRAHQRHPTPPDVLGVADGLKMIRVKASPMFAISPYASALMWVVAQMIQLHSLRHWPVDAHVRVDVYGDAPAKLVSYPRISAAVHAERVKPAAGLCDFPMGHQTLPHTGKRNASRILSLSHSILLQSFWSGSRGVISVIAAPSYFSRNAEGIA
jgi:hypothetical protein